MCLLSIFVNEILTMFDMIPFHSKLLRGHTLARELAGIGMAGAKDTHHDDVIKWEHFPCYWIFVWGIHWSLVNSPQKGQWHGALMVSLVCAWTNNWVNNRDFGSFKCHHTNYDVTVMDRLEGSLLSVWLVWLNHNSHVSAPLSIDIMGFCQRKITYSLVMYQNICTQHERHMKIHTEVMNIVWLILYLNL